MEVVVQAEAPRGSYVDLLHPDGSRLGRIVSYREEPGIQRHSMDRILLPTTGLYRVRVWYDFEAQHGENPYGIQGPGPYRIRVMPIDRGPEVVAPVIVYGQVVDTEPIYPVHDVDVFSFDGAAGDTIVLSTRKLEHQAHQQPLWVVVRRGDTGEMVGDDPSGFFGTPGTTMVLPATARYEIDVRSAEHPMWVTVPYYGLYRLELRRGP